MQRELTLSVLTQVFLRIGLLSFGGPAAQIALMHRTLVDERKWLTERQFLDALGFCMLLPGPEAMQLATYAGWRLRGIPGGLIAGLLFVVPGALVIFALATIYAVAGQVDLVQSLFLGIKAAVLIIVIQALLKVAGRALTGLSHWMIAGLAFLGIFFLAIPFPLIVLAAGLWGLATSGAPDHTPAPVAVRPTATLSVFGIGLALWLLPLVGLSFWGGWPILGDIGAFFARLAVVTFGGAYAVLAYMAQDVVTGQGWITAGQMMDGLGLAETTPGPLILVTQFVGFLAGYGAGGMELAWAAALVTLWATFVPCFVWIFAGAPYIDWIAGQPRLKGALAAITAAVVGVILNLSLWFALHVAFTSVTREAIGPLTLWVPDWATLDLRVLAISVLAAVMLLRLRLGLGWVLAASALAGWALVALGA
ncbi:MAG: chromate efflux transporter [Flavimaricola sp.]|nr:chromate efflux transporter [Flavimaricola sp.]